MKRLILLVALPLVLAACGGNSSGVGPSDAAFARAGARVDVTTAIVKLARARLNGGDLPTRTAAVVKALRQANKDGVSDRWLNHEIDFGQRIAADCLDCVNDLELARP